VIWAPGSPRSWHAGLHDRPADPMTLSSPTVPRRVTTTKRRSPQPNGARRRVCPHRTATYPTARREFGACHLGLGIRPASRRTPRAPTRSLAHGRGPWLSVAVIAPSVRSPRLRLAVFPPPAPRGCLQDPPDQMPGVSGNDGRRRGAAPGRRGLRSRAGARKRCRQDTSRGGQGPRALSVMGSTGPVVEAGVP